jgi:hypothetical protein
MLKQLIEEVYESARLDDWSGELISDETEKVHATFKLALESFTAVLNSSIATPEERKWARDKIDQLL